MIGEKTFDIKAENFFAGMSSALFANDNGFASGGNISGTIFPTTLNLTAKPGVLYPAGNTVDRTPASDLTSLLIASSADSNFLGYDRVFISDDAKFYSFDGTTLTLRHTDATASRSYTAGKTSMVTLGFSCFTTSSGTNTGISKWAMSSNTFTDNFFAFSDTIAPHLQFCLKIRHFTGMVTFFLDKQTKAALLLRFSISKITPSLPHSVLTPALVACSLPLRRQSTWAIR